MASLHNMRDGNRIRLLQTLSLVGEADRAALARMTGLSRATVSGLLGQAIARGQVVERRADPAVPPGRRGRPALLRLEPRAGMVAGVDLGHSHVRVALADLSAAVVGERRVAFDIDAAPCVALDTAASLVDEVVRAADLDPRRLLGAGMAVAKPLDRATGTVRATAARGRWPGVSPGEELARRLGCPSGWRTTRTSARSASTSRAPPAARRTSSTSSSPRVSAPGCCSTAPCTSAPADGRRARPRHRRAERQHLPLRQPRLPRDGRVGGRARCDARP